MNDEYDDEPRPRSYQRCRDRICGATDCPTCFPFTYRDEDAREAEEQDALAAEREANYQNSL